MLVCNVSLRPPRRAIAADLAETVSATDATATGNVVFATLVDDPASVLDFVDAYLGEIMLEVASAADAISVGTQFDAAITESSTATSAEDATRSGDPYWTSVKLLMGFEGADASTGSPGMTDESSAAHGTGTVHFQAQIDTAQFQFGSSSLLLDGTTDWVTFADHADFDLGISQFTIEAWVRPTTVSGTHFICGQWESVGLFGWIFYQSSAQIWLNISTTTSDNISHVGGGTLTANTWNAVCVDFDGTKYRIYINGSMVASTTTLKTIANSGAAFTIGGSSSSGSFSFAGWIDELRLTKGVARYASDSGYTVATSAFPRS